MIEALNSEEKLKEILHLVRDCNFDEYSCANYLVISVQEVYDLIKQEYKCNFLDFKNSFNENKIDNKQTNFLLD